MKSSRKIVKSLKNTTRNTCPDLLVEYHIESITGNKKTAEQSTVSEAIRSSLVLLRFRGPKSALGALTLGFFWIFTKTWGIYNKSFRSSLSRKAGRVRGQRPRSPAAAGETFTIM